MAYFTASCDPVKKNTDFAKSLNLDYPILSDPSKKTAKAYGVLNEQRGFSLRWTYYIGKDGKVVWRGHPGRITEDMLKDWTGA